LILQLSFAFASMAKLDVKMTNSYPPLNLEAAPSTPDERAALEAAEAIRAWTAQNYGLEQLAIMDQYARACIALGVTKPEMVIQVTRDIKMALAGFMFRGFQTGQAPAPQDIQNALVGMADGARAMAKGLLSLRQARQGVGLENQNRAVELKRLHRNVVRAIADDALPRSLCSFSEDALESTIPTASHIAFNDEWTANWLNLAGSLSQIADSADLIALKSPTRQNDEAFVNFVHRLGEVYRQFKGKAPRADARKATQPEGWHSPFVRFLLEVWPLTPEGSNGISPPGDNRIARALKATPIF
jgi:hypothetical protein